MKITADKLHDIFSKTHSFFLNCKDKLFYALQAFSVNDFVQSAIGITVRSNGAKMKQMCMCYVHEYQFSLYIIFVMPFSITLLSVRVNKLLH